MEAKRPAQPVQAVAPKSLRGKSSQRRTAAPELWPMVAKTAVGPAERWPLTTACPWAAAQEERASRRLTRRATTAERGEQAGASHNPYRTHRKHHRVADKTVGH